MIFSLACIIIVSFVLVEIFNRLQIPNILAMLLTGIILGPHMLNLISGDLLDVSADIRKMALIVILLRAGLSLDIHTLKKVGKPALLMSFIPAIFEITIITFLAPIFFEISTLEAAILGAVIAAVSPAIIVPRMLMLIEKNRGTKKGIPYLIMASASIDDIFVIVLFTSFIGMYQGDGFHATGLLTIPLSIILGGLLGYLSGKVCVYFFKKIHVRDTSKVLVILAISFLFVTLEDYLEGTVAVSGLIAVMVLGITILKDYEILAKRLLSKFSKVWVVGELLLFVLVGAIVDVTLVTEAGLLAILLLLLALVFRIIGVYISLLGSGLSNKEKLFCGISFLPKATVQAAIGSIPLSLGIPSGSLILAIAVMAIVITAPIGAFGIDKTYKKLI